MPEAKRLYYPWRANSNPSTETDWYITHAETGKRKKIGRVGAKRVNNYDRAVQEAHARNCKLQGIAYSPCQ